MTADDESSLTPGSGGAERHRLVPAETIRAQCLARYGSGAVAAYLLAVREEVERHPDIGAVDTWSRFARLLHRCSASSNRGRDRIRKELSRHFTVESKGPPWKTAMLVVRYVVPEDRRQRTQAAFAVLYQSARGEPAPTGVPAPRDPADAGPAPNRGGDPLSAMQAIIDRLRARVAVLEKELALARAQLQAARPEPSAGSTRSNDGRYPVRPRTGNVPRRQQLLASSNRRRKQVEQLSSGPLVDAEKLLRRLPQQPSPAAIRVATWIPSGERRAGW
ncbi:hypothetical protein O7627_36630 [Solwaraspora sp. WMMD1047]|uniref:hypothetical protein n=1 Tax=Solwaraspora sp. WMMD1047 TaxID=3016102 RepID=UPI0024171E08|nr:hypothetical protein [Solwaraspora sp. WMMD1047]MDG4834796.1 hypothetical protein [Solwaraspora sp. WMMD1047]